MKNTMPLILIISLFFGCNKHEKQNSTIDGKWLSTMKVDNGTFKYEPNTFLQLQNGQGQIHNIGLNSLNFNYSIEKGYIKLTKLPGNKKGNLKIIQETEGELVIENFRNDTIQFRRMNDVNIDKSDLLNLFADQTYKLKNTISITPELFHFNEKKLIKISEIIAKPNFDYTSEETLAQFYNLEKMNWEIINVGGTPFIKLLDFQDYKNHPVIGFVESINEQDLTLKTFIDHKIKSLAFEKIDLPAIDKSELIGIWMGALGKLKLEIIDEEKFRFKKNKTTYSGTWSIDNSNKLLILNGENEKLIFATLNKKRDGIVMEDQPNSTISLSRKY